MTTKSEIDWSTARGQAYACARDNPGVLQSFQNEGGFSSVYYVPEVEAATLFDVEISPSKPGHWYEVTIMDITKIVPDRLIGFRVYDIDEVEEEDV